MPTKLDSSLPHLEAPASFAGPRKDWGYLANPTAGASKSDGVLLHKGLDGQPEVDLWQGTPGTWPLEIPYDELCHFISGSATYSRETGEIIAVRAASVVLFPTNWKGACTVHQTMRNVHMLS
jgi:uncharacterized cupin superfamily protein